MTLPENTVEAFRAGLLGGANALEMDVQRTMDDAIIVFHDEDGQRVAGQSAKIGKTSFSEIQKWKVKVPTLAEVIEAFPGIPLNVDIKAHDAKTVTLVIDEVNKLDAQHRVLLTSMSARVIAMLRSSYDGQIGLSALEVAALYFIPKFLLRGFGFAGRAAQIPLRWSFFRLDRRGFIDKCHDLGLRVDYWVVNDEQTARRLVAVGADGIMSDDPGLLRAGFPLQSG